MRFCTLCGGILVPTTFTDKYGNVWELYECPDDGWLEPASTAPTVELQAEESEAE